MTGKPGGKTGFTKRGKKRVRTMQEGFEKN